MHRTSIRPSIQSSIYDMYVFMSEGPLKSPFEVAFYRVILVTLISDEMQSIGDLETIPEIHQPILAMASSCSREISY